MPHIRILMLEDSPLDAELIQRTLTRAAIKFSVERVEDEAGFRHAIESFNPDVILADYNLPNFDGLSALRIAHQLVPQTPFIFVSGSIGEELAVTAMTEGASDYILKDRLTRLPTAVTKAISERRESLLRRNTQDALRISEQRFRYVAAATNDIILDRDLQTGMVWFNEALRTCFGYDLGTDQVSESWLEEQIHPDDRAHVLSVLESAIESSTDRVRLQFRFRRADGEYRIVDKRGVIVRDQNQTPLRFICALTDITEQERSKEVLLAEREFLHAILDNVEDGIVACDEAGHITVVNRAMRNVWGGSPTETMSDSWLQKSSSFHLDRVTPVKAEETPLYRALKGERVRNAALLVPSPTGELRTIIFNGVPLRGARGESTGAVIVGTDVTEKQFATRELERLTKRNALLLRSVGDGLYGLSNKGAPIFVNPAAEQMTGWTVEEMLSGGNVHDLIHHTKADGTPHPIEECPIFKTLIDGIPRSSADELFWRKDGSSFPVEYTAAPIVEDSQISGCVVTFRDISERLALQRKVARAERIDSLGRASATIAHEINNVLMGISPFAEVIKRQAKENEKVAAAADHIANAVARGRKITEEILRFAQPRKSSSESFDLASWLRKIQPELEVLLGGGLALSVVIDDEPLPIRCDPNQLHQVVSNMAINALHAAKGEGLLQIIARRPEQREQISFGFPVNFDNFVLLSLSDNGQGIQPDVMKNIFEPLFTTKRSGTGLGLALARQLVEEWGGSISVESEPGVGTTFHLLIPRADQAAMSPSPHVSSSPRLLIVEDDPSIGEGIATLLELEGMRVRLVSRGDEALKLIEEFRPDGVILDLHLEDGDGRRVYDAAVARWPELPFIFSTGAGDEDIAPLLARPGRTAALRKPYSIDTLLDLVRDLVQPGKSLRALQPVGPPRHE
jgi:PAS domain S-box-containing protein